MLVLRSVLYKTSVGFHFNNLFGMIYEEKKKKRIQANNECCLAKSQVSNIVWIVREQSLSETNNGALFNAKKTYHEQSKLIKGSRQSHRRSGHHRTYDKNNISLIYF